MVFQRFVNRYLALASISSAIAVSSTIAVADEYDATGIANEGDLLNEILQGLKPSDYDTIVFKGPGQFEVYENIQGGVPPYTGTLGIDSLFQNMRFEGASTSDTFFFEGGRSNGCLPCIPETHTLSTHSLTIDNIAWSLRPDQITGDYIEDFIINNRGTVPGEINLNNGHLKLDQAFGSGAQLSFGGATVFNITGADNKIIAPGGAINRSIYDTRMHLHAGSKLEVSGTTELNMRDHGYLQMDAGSELTIIDSKVVLTKQATASTPDSVIDGSSVSISGLFGSDPSSLVLSNPTIKNSTIILGQNTRFASSTKASAILQPANFHFDGDNTVTLALGSALVGFSGEDNDEITTFNFNNGRTDIVGTGASARLFAQAIHLDNAHLYHEDVEIQNDLEFLSLSNGSTLSHKENNGESLENLKTLNVVNSSLESDYSIGIAAITKATFNNATIRQTDSRLTRPTSFYLNGLNIDASTKATVTFLGNSVFESRIDPAGKDVGIPIGANTGILSYADALYFTRWGNYTDEASSVNGLANLTVELKPFAAGLSADDYANGGENSDGIYDVLIFNQGGSATTDATADSDTVAVRLDADMPALLTVTQVATPSADGQVSYQLQAQPVTSLVTHPTLTTQNQQSVAALLAQGSNAGNNQLQNALNAITANQLQNQIDSLHAEPYSSYMTVSLEHLDIVMNTVFNQTTRRQAVIAGQASEASGTDTDGRTWMDVSYAEGDVDGSKGLGDFEYTLTGLTIGHDLIATEENTLGVYFSYGSQKMDEHDAVDQNFEGDMYHLGLYLGRSNIGDWDVSGLVAYGYGEHSSERSASLVTTNAPLSADYESHSLYAGAKAAVVGYENNWLTVSPELGLNYAYYRQNAFKESGDQNLNLKVDSADAQAIIASAGLNAKFASLIANASVYPLAFVRFEHDFYAKQNSEHEVKAALAAHPDSSQKFVGQNRGENSLITGLGIGSDLSSALQIEGGIVYANHSHGSEWGAGLNARFLW